MKRRIVSFFAAALLSSAFLPALGSAPAPQAKDVPADVMAIIKQNCSVSGCHQGKYPAAWLNMEPDQFLTSVIDKPSQEAPGRKIVNTADPAASYLLAKIKGEAGISGKRMPLNRDPLATEQIQKIEAWTQSLKKGPAENVEDSLSESPRSGPFIGSSGEKPEIRQSEAVQASKVQPRGFSKPAFWGTRIINLPTTTTIGRGEFLFRISHRFQPPISSGWDSFFGLDGPAFILFSFGYGISDNLTLTLGRSKLYQEWELYADWLIFEQGEKSPIPLSAALHIGGNLVTQDEPADVDWSGRFRFGALLSLSYQASNAFSVLVVPAFSSNTNFWENPSEGTFSLGLGGRFMFLPDLSLIAEWIPVLAGFKDTTNGWGVGLEKKIGGHVFQFFVTNSLGITASQFVTGGDLKLQDGDFRLGFNIFRTF